MRRVLAVCCDAESCQAIEDAVQPWRFETVACPSFQESINLLEREDFTLVFYEDGCSDQTYRDLQAMLRSSKAPVIVMTPLDDPKSVFREAISLGALDVLPSPCSKRDVQWMVIRATQHKPLTRSPQ